MKRAKKVLEVIGLKLEIENNGLVSMSEDENKDLGDNQCEARVVTNKGHVQSKCNHTCDCLGL